MPKLLNRRTFCAAAAIAMATAQIGSIAAQDQKFSPGDYERPLNSDIVLGMAYTPTNYRAQTSANSQTTLNAEARKETLTIQDLRFFATESAIERSLSTNRLIDAAVGYDAQVFSVSGKFSNLKDIVENETTITYYCAAEIGTNEETILTKDISISEQLHRDADKDTDAVIYNKYGTDVVTSIIRGARVVAVYEFKCSSKELRRKIQAHLEGKVTYKGNWNGSGDLERVVKSIDKNATLSVRFEQHGGVNLGILEQLPEAQKNNLDVVKQAIGQAFKTVDPNKLPVIRFKTTPLGALEKLKDTAFGKRYWAVKGYGQPVSSEQYAALVHEFLVAYVKAIRWQEDVRLVMATCKNKDIRDEWEKYENKLADCLESLRAYSKQNDEAWKAGTLIFKANDANRIKGEAIKTCPVQPQHPPLVVPTGWRHGAYGRNQGGGYTFGILTGRDQWDVLYSYPKVEIPLTSLIKSLQLKRKGKFRIEELTLEIDHTNLDVLALQQEGKGNPEVTNLLREAAKHRIQLEMTALAQVAAWGGTMPDGKPLEDLKLPGRHSCYETPTGGTPFNMNFPGRTDPFRPAAAKFVSDENTKQLIRNLRGELSKYEYYWEVIYHGSNKPEIIPLNKFTPGNGDTP